MEEKITPEEWKKLWEPINEEFDKFYKKFGEIMNDSAVGLTFKSYDISPEALLATFGGSIENGVWSTPKHKNNEDNDYWLLDEVKDNEIIFRYAGNFGSIYQAFPITLETLSFWWKIIAMGPSATFKISKKLNITNTQSGAIVEFGGLLSLDKEKQ